MYLGQNVCLDYFWVRFYDTQMSDTGPSWPSFFLKNSRFYFIALDNRDISLIFFYLFLLENMV